MTEVIGEQPGYTGSLNDTVFVLNITWFLLDMTWFVINMTKFVLNITYFDFLFNHMGRLQPDLLVLTDWPPEFQYCLFVRLVSEYIFSWA